MAERALDGAALPMIISRADRITLKWLAGATAGIAAAVVGFAVANAVHIVSGDATIELLATGPLPGTAVDATISRAVVASSEIGDGAVTLLVVGLIIDTLVWATVTIAILALLLHLAQSRPFHRSVSRFGFVAGFALVIGGLLGPWITGFGLMSAADHLGGSPDGPFTVGFAFSPTTVGIGFVVLVLATVFRVGTRLQRDSEGLV